MKIAFLILAHKNPKQLRWLINSLKGSHAVFFIHIDKKVDVRDFKNGIEGIGDVDIYFVKREKTQWGDFSLVQATLNCLKLASTKGDFDFFVLLSGQDFPIKSNLEIMNFFSNHKGNSFIEGKPFPVESLKYDGLERINSYSFNIFGKRHTYIPWDWNPTFNWKGKLINLALGGYCKLLPKRRFPESLKAYYGSQWWTLNEETAIFVLNFLKSDPHYIQYHKKSLIPDEMFFQSIVFSKKDELKKTIIENKNLHHIEWGDGKSHPKTLTKEDLFKLKKSEKLFARKFDLTIDPEIFKTLKTKII